MGERGAAGHYGGFRPPRSTVELARRGAERLGGSAQAILASPGDSFFLRTVAASGRHSARAKRRRFEVSERQAAGCGAARLRRTSDHGPRRQTLLRISTYVLPESAR